LKKKKNKKLKEDVEHIYKNHLWKKNRKWKWKASLKINGGNSKFYKVCEQIEHI